MADVQQTPSKEDNKPEEHPEDEDSPLSPEQPIEKLCKRYHESEQMNKLFADLVRDNQKQFKEQGEKHKMQIAAMKRANLSRRARVVDVVLLVVQQASGSNPSVHCGFSPLWFSSEWPFPHTLHTGGYKYGSPTFRFKVSMGFSLLGVP
jgi:hypothetical protein